MINHKIICRYCLLISIICYLCLLEKNLFAFEQLIIDESRITSAITKHIEKHMIWPKGTVRITFPSGIPEITIPSKDYKIEVKDNRNDEYIGERLYYIKVIQKNNYNKQIAIQTRIEVSKDVALSSKFITKDKNVLPEDIIVVKKWFNRLPNELITNPAEIIGKRVVRSINAKTAFTSSMLANPLMFKKGKVVKIVCDSDILNISTLGLAEEEGSLGAMVKVRNISSNKIIRAKVIGDSIVKVEI
jgi:flagella basal body P-ring formation protein FlgA